MCTISKKKLDFLKKCETGNVADAYVRLGLAKDMAAYTVSSGKCKPFNFEDAFAGPAVTVRFAPMLPGQTGGRMFDIFTDSVPGSVVVMAGIKGEYCFMGDVLAKYAAHQRMEAIVAEGYVRDSKGCIRAGVPVFSRGGTTAAKGKDLYSIAEINKPICFHGIIINPGDILMGDCDGIINIPAEIFDDVYKELQEIVICEEKYDEAFRIGGEGLLENLKKVSAQSH